MTLVFDAIGFGALNIDKLFRVNGIAGAEEERQVIGFEESCGGSAANTMVGLARLACRVGFIGKVANDREGRLLLEAFQTEKVNTNGIQVAKRGTSGVVMGFVDEKGDRALYVDPGVNNTLELKDATFSYACKAGFIHLTSFAGGASFEAQKSLVQKLPETTKVSFDPGALYAEKGLAELESIIDKTYVLLPNANELQRLTGAADFKNGAEAMLKKGVEIVAVKLGSRGCYVTDGKERHLLEAFRVKVVDTTGAGDAFCAGFLYGLIGGKSLRECGVIGNFVASRCVMKLGARAGLPRLKDLELLS